MKTLKEFTPLFTAGIFLISFLALLLAGFSSLLNAKIDPIKKDITRLEMGVKDLEVGQKALEAGQKDLEERLENLEEEVKELGAGVKELKEILLSK